MTDDRAQLDDMVAYYRARATEYDEWFERRGRYDRGEDHRARWRDDIHEVAAWFDALELGGDVLELAGGTGWWTERLAGRADRLTVVDASPEVLDRSRERVGRDDVEYIEADLFEWRPAARYDVVFFSFWLSHVPPVRFDGFWETVEGAIADGGRVVFIDSLATETSGAIDHRRRPGDGTMTTRKLNDGSEFTIVKVFYDLDDLTTSLARLGWSATIERTDEFFLYGTATRA